VLGGHGTQAALFSPPVDGRTTYAREQNVYAPLSRFSPEIRTQNWDFPQVAENTWQCGQ